MSRNTNRSLSIRNHWVRACFHYFFGYLVEGIFVDFFFKFLYVRFFIVIFCSNSTMRRTAESLNNIECSWTHHSRWKQPAEVQQKSWLTDWLASWLVCFCSIQSVCVCVSVLPSLCHSHGCVDEIVVVLFLSFFASYFFIFCSLWLRMMMMTMVNRHLMYVYIHIFTE